MCASVNYPEEFSDNNSGSFFSASLLLGTYRDFPSEGSPRGGLLFCFCLSLDANLTLAGVCW